MAAGNGTWRGRRTVVPPPANSPRLGSMTAEVRLGHRHPEVAPAEHLHAARHAGAVHRGDDRLVELHAAQHGLHPVVDAGSRRAPRPGAMAISLWSFVTWGM